MVPSANYSDLLQNKADTEDAAASAAAAAAAAAVAAAAAAVAAAATTATHDADAAHDDNSAAAADDDDELDDGESILNGTSCISLLVRHSYTFPGRQAIEYRRHRRGRVVLVSDRCLRSCHN